MADSDIGGLTELTTPADGDFIPIVDVSEADDGDKNKKITRENLAGWTFLTTPLTSTSWDGDNKTDADRSIVDLSAVFGVPAGVKAVLMTVQGSSSTAGNYIRFGPTSTYNYVLNLRAQVASVINIESGIVPCDNNGDIYCYVGTGQTITGVYVWIWGYWL